MSQKEESDLSGFSEEEILVTLVERNALFICECGCCYQDETLYDLHRSVHSGFDPLICVSCGYVARNFEDFNKHLFGHA